MLQKPQAGLGHGRGGGAGERGRKEEAELYVRD